MTQTTLGTVIVTGGAGFIGCAISAILADRAERWIAIDSLNPRIHATSARPDRLAPAAELVVADITRPETWAQVLEDAKPDIVIHLAAETDTGLSLHHVTRFSEVNVTGTAVMLDALSARGIAPSHMLVASSRAVYGEGSWIDDETGELFSPGQRTHQQLSSGAWDFPGASPVAAIAERTPPHATSIYGATKYAQESMMSAWCGGRDVPLTVLRLQNVYGPGQSLINPYTGILPLFVQAAARDETIDVYEDGLMTRDFVHVSDVAAAFAAAVEGDAAPATRIFDIGAGVATSILDVARLIARRTGGPEPTVSGRFRDGDIRHAWCTVQSAASALGWQPEIDWQAGIGDYVDRHLAASTLEGVRP